MQGATAVLGLGVMAVTQGAGSSTLQSQALTQVKNEFMPEKTEAFQDFDFVHNESLEILPCPCEPGHHNFSLDDTYMNFDMRESYLTR
jgi:hypothetical protein